MIIQTRPVRTRNRTLHNENLTTRYRTLSKKNLLIASNKNTTKMQQKCEQKCEHKMWP